MNKNLSSEALRNIGRKKQLQTPVVWRKVVWKRVFTVMNFWLLFSYQFDAKLPDWENGKRSMVSDTFDIKYGDKIF